MGGHADSSVPLISVVRIRTSRSWCAGGPRLLETSGTVYGGDECGSGEVGETLEGMERERPRSSE